MTEARKKNKTGKNQPDMLTRKLLLGFCLSILGGTSLVLAQEPGVINGTIADENNDPLVGAFITEITTHKSIASDKNGSFLAPCQCRQAGYSGHFISWVS